MIAYNKQWLDNNGIQAQLEEAMEESCITKEENAAAASQYKDGFYTPNIFIRIGLFILTVVIAAFSCGLFGLIFISGGSESSFGGFLIFCGLICYGMLEFMVQGKGHYRSGVDDALLLLTVVFIISGFNIMGNISYATNAFLVLLIAAYGFVRFANRVMAFVAAVALLAFVFFMLGQMGAIAKAVTPFVLMLVAAALYFTSKWAETKAQYKYYHSCFTIIQITVLLCFYIAGNYFAVRETSNVFFGLQLKPTDGIPLGWLFWLFTIAIPLLYIGWGIVKKDIVLIRTGLLLTAAIVFTVRYYYAVLPAEVAMMIAGVILLVVSYLLTRLLKQPKAGFTSQPARASNKNALLNIEAIIIAETLSPGQQQEQTHFGGGSFGGGGASSDF